MPTYSPLSNLLERATGYSTIRSIMVGTETYELSTTTKGNPQELVMPKPSNLMGVKLERVIFNDPATIVFWSDGTKTIVKANNEPFDKEKGLAMAIIKKIYGNKGNFNNIFRKYCAD